VEVFAMTQLERQIDKARHRLWLNRWFHDASAAVAVAAAVFGLVVLVQRLFDAAIPLFWIGVALGAVALIVSVVRTVVGREDRIRAAARLDQAAGLRERLSTGCFCVGDDDPFARAVVVDAERISGSLSARQHLPLRMPKPAGWSLVSVVGAALMFLISPGLLARSEATEAKEQAAQLEQTAVAVKRKMDAVRKMAETTPALQELKDHLDGRDLAPAEKLRKPADLRHQAMKKIDRLADAVKQKRASTEYEAAREMRKMMRGLKVPQSADTATQKLSKALAKGDFKTAKEEVNVLREQLATLKSEQDKELAAKLSKQLTDMAKQLEQLASDEKLAQKLEQAGIKKEDAERLLESLKKEDLDQLQKELEKQGLTPKQAQKMAQQMKRQQQAGGMAQQLAQALGQGAQAGQGQSSNAVAGLSAAADQLSELELLQQEMNQLDAALADLQNARADLGQPGPPGGGGQKPGPGMGQLGQGRGSLAPEEETAIGFKTERGEVKTGEGAIIGQFLFEGEQVKGDVSSSLTEIVSAAEHDASDRINRNRIPRQYHQAVKSYFSTMQRSIADANLTNPATAGGGTTDESKDDTGGESGTD
jgi:hypothetical protein